MSSQLPSYPGNMFGFYHQNTQAKVGQTRAAEKGKQGTASEQRKKDVVDVLKHRQVDRKYIDEFLTFWSTKQPAINNFLSSLTTVDSAVKVALFFYRFRAWGFSLEQASRILVFVAGLKSTQALSIIEATLKGGERMGKMLKVAGDFNTGATVFITGVQVAVLVRDGQYSQVAATIYKTWIGTAVPWGGAIDALQTVIEMFVPAFVQNNSTLFKVIRAVDPVGLGGIGIDTLVFFVQSAVEALKGKPFNDKRLGELVTRMKSGPTRVFAELGEEAGDALYDILQMDAQDWRLVATYTWQQVGELFKKKGKG